jgi:hypothetical protein
MTNIKLGTTTSDEVLLEQARILLVSNAHSDETLYHVQSLLERGKLEEAFDKFWQTRWPQGIVSEKDKKRKQSNKIRKQTRELFINLPTPLSSKYELLNMLANEVYLFSVSNISSPSTLSLNGVHLDLQINASFLPLMRQLASYTTKAKTGKGEIMIAFLFPNSRLLGTKERGGDIKIQGKSVEVKLGPSSINPSTGTDKGLIDGLNVKLATMLNVKCKECKGFCKKSKAHAADNAFNLDDPNSLILQHLNQRADGEEILTNYLQELYPIDGNNVSALAKNVWAQRGTSMATQHIAQYVFDRAQRTSGFDSLLLIDEHTLQMVNICSGVGLQVCTTRYRNWRGGDTQAVSDGWINIEPMHSKQPKQPPTPPSLKGVCTKPLRVGTKKEMAQTILNEALGLGQTRSQIIQRFIEEANLTLAGANTYYHLLTHPILASV